MMPHIISELENEYCKQFGDKTEVHECHSQILYFLHHSKHTIRLQKEAIKRYSPITKDEIIKYLFNGNEDEYYDCIINLILSSHCPRAEKFYKANYSQPLQS